MIHFGFGRVEIQSLLRCTGHERCLIPRYPIGVTAAIVRRKWVATLATRHFEITVFFLSGSHDKTQ